MKIIFDYETQSHIPNTNFMVKKYLEKYNDNMKLVAEKLDIGIATIYRMLKEEN
jgi:transcriptional regulator with PAS, ATPase and Fis domain